jgi:2-methylisocitrate lyase-like PEP mutase family enzyme
MTRAHFEQFRALHQPPSAAALVLPNAWDALSARLVEEAGAPAVATGSAALAWARGARSGLASA